MELILCRNYVGYVYVCVCLFLNNFYFFIMFFEDIM